MPASEKTKVQLSLLGPQPAQYEGTPMLNIYAESVEELFEMSNEFFNKDVTADLQAIFDLHRATAVLSAGTEAKVVESKPKAAPKAKPKAKAAPASDTSSYGECPQCDGTVVKKFKKAGGHFFGCDQFPDCKYGRNTPEEEE